MSRTAYQFSHAGMYTGMTDADESPLEPGVYLLPARSTFVKAPLTWPDGQWPRWNGAGWELVTAPAPANDNDPVTKLRAFLNENPDVAALLQSNDGGANV